jgi:hypothetical protein
MQKHIHTPVTDKHKTLQITMATSCTQSRRKSARKHNADCNFKTHIDIGSRISTPSTPEIIMQQKMQTCPWLPAAQAAAPEQPAQAAAPRQPAAAVQAEIPDDVQEQA